MHPFHPAVVARPVRLLGVLTGTAVGLLVTAAAARAEVAPVLPPGVPAPAVPGTNTVPDAPGVSPVVPGGASTDWSAVTLAVVLVALSVVLFVVAVTTLSWMLHAWRSPEHLSGTRFRAETDEPADLPEPRHTFSLLVPGRHEELVLGQTLDRLADSTHPFVQVIAIVGDDDPGTREVAEQAAARNPGRVEVVVDSSVPKNKPKALNTALAYCTGDIVGIFDAEDDVHPDLLGHVDARFSATDADVVQGGVQLMNVHTSWWTLRNCLEYYFWFRSRLHFHAQQAFIPLGGNTVFTRRELLVEHGGWDPECLAEDCEIGVRLSSHGAKVVVAYEPEVVTREETPDTIRSLVKQRTRWNQGFLQVLRKGEWRKLPTRGQRMLARYTLSMPFLQAFTGLLVPLSVVTMFVIDVPTGIVLLTLLPIAPTVLTVAMEMVAYGDFCRTYGAKSRVRDYVYLILGAIPYQLILAFSAARAVVRQVRGQGSWEKTSHSNLHREAPREPVPTGSDAA